MSIGADLRLEMKVVSEHFHPVLSAFLTESKKIYKNSKKNEKYKRIFWFYV